MRQKSKTRAAYFIFSIARIKYQPPLLTVVKDRAVRARLKMPTVAAFIFTTHIRLGARLLEIGAILYFVQAASSQSAPVNKSKFHITAMFVLCTSRYAAPVKFTPFASLYHIVLAKLAHKICAVAIKALVKFTLFTRHYFVPQIQPRRLLANSIKFKWIRFQRLALVKF